MDLAEERKLRKEKEKQLKKDKALNKKDKKFNIDSTKEKKKLKVSEVEIYTKPGEKKDVTCELPKAYCPNYTEEGWFNWWDKQGYFKPEYNEKKSNEKFVIMIPPPNVTGVLHIGHALTISVEDSLVRYNRMLGKQTLWLPGTDHAGIATQTVLEKKIQREQNKTRHDLGREAFIEEIWKWKHDKGGRIMDQLKQLGGSCDFTRMRFTMDPGMYKAVTESFVRLYEDGSIYRANRLVNWSCALKSAISDIEVEKREINGKTLLPVPGYNKPVEFGILVHFAYEIVDCNTKLYVATTRIETMLGDTAIAVHPEDDRYKQLHGKYARHPFVIDRKIPIVCDEMVDREFGTGAVKITPSHDQNDYEVGKRHNLPFINIFSDDGKILDGFGEFSGMKRFDCRKVMLERLDGLGLLEKVENHNMVVPICTRSKEIIEPLIKNQWYLNCKEMANEAIEKVCCGDLKLLPEGVHDATWNRWLENIHDWCISRQLWWGHRIPMYKVKINGSYVNNDVESSWIPGRNNEEAVENAKVKYGCAATEIEVEQDEDVLDTWFSSQLFPFATMGWPESTPDLEKYFPGELLETGHDILFFWVARMVMISLRLTGKLPFSKVFLHAMVRDAHGRKMSKSLGNVLDPYDVIKGIELKDLQKSLESGNLDPRELSKAKTIQAKDFPNGIPQCGTDALRFALISYTSQWRDINLDVQRVFGYRTFCNKLWQAYKYAGMFGIDCKMTPNLKEVYHELTKVDKWILSKLASTITEVNQSMSEYNMSTACSALHKFWIYDFCDVYVEYSKNFKNCAKRQPIVAQVILQCFDSGLRLLHPMMPFITEELFQRLPKQHNEDSICVCPYPGSDLESDSTKLLLQIDQSLEQDMNEALELTKKLRSFRKDKNIKDKQMLDVVVEIKDNKFAHEYLQDVVLALSKCQMVTKSKGEIIFDHNKYFVCYLAGEQDVESQGDPSHPIQLDLKSYFSIDADEEALNRFQMDLVKFPNCSEKLSEKQELYSRHMINYLNSQTAKGKSHMKATCEFINRYLASVTYLADTKYPGLCDAWLMKYLELNKINNHGFLSKFVNINRWFQTVDFQKL